MRLFSIGQGLLSEFTAYIYIFSDLGSFGNNSLMILLKMCRQRLVWTHIDGAADVNFQSNFRSSRRVKNNFRQNKSCPF